MSLFVISAYLDREKIVAVIRNTILVITITIVS